MIAPPRLLQPESPLAGDRSHRRRTVGPRQPSRHQHTVQKPRHCCGFRRTLSIASLLNLIDTNWKESKTQSKLCSINSISIHQSWVHLIILLHIIFSHHQSENILWCVVRLVSDQWTLSKYSDIVKLSFLSTILMQCTICLVNTINYLSYLRNTNKYYYRLCQLPMNKARTETQHLI